MAYTVRVGSNVEWRTLRETICSGDILLCQTYGFFGILEQIPTDSPYTHVAMFLRCTNNRLYILESAIDKSYKDVITEKTDGPKLVDADKYISHYLGTNSGMLTYRPLRMRGTNRPFSFSEKQKKNIINEIAFLIQPSVKYERKIGDLANAFFRIYNLEISDPNYFFCSELVSTMYMHFGIYLRRPSDKFIPRDFCQKQEDLFSVSMNKGKKSVYLGTEVTIVLRI